MVVRVTLVAIVLSLSVAATAAALTRVQAGADVSPAGPHPDTTCWIGGLSSPQCATPTAGASTGIVAGRGFGAASVELRTGQVRGFANHAAIPPGSGSSGANTYAMFDDNVTMHLAPGATWPQTFIVRGYVRGVVSLSSPSCCYTELKFGTAIDEVHSYDGSIAVTYERNVTITQESTYAVRARVDTHRNNSSTGSADFGTSPDSGVRFEVDLPPGLTMTSDSGVLMTERPHVPDLVMPTPCAAGFCFGGIPVGGVPRVRKFDPPVVTGYEYQVSAGGFALVSLPVGIGDGLYDLYVFDPVTQSFVLTKSLSGGEVYYFEGTVTRFQVRGIEVSANLDPADATAFVTDLAFLSDGDEDLVMTPLTAVTGIPALPGAWPILVVAAAAAVIAARRRRSARQPPNFAR